MPVEDGADVGDTGTSCRAPDAYRADETPTEGEEPPYDVCDGLDNGCDGATDEGCICDYNNQSAGVCEDQTRTSDGTCPEPEAYEDPEDTCSDNLDNDCDGTTDCADGDCAGQACGAGSGAICQGGSCVEQECNDGTDNDGDGDADCADPDCDGQSCGPGGQTCCSGADTCGLTC